MNYQVKIIKEKSTNKKMAVMSVEQWKAIEQSLLRDLGELNAYTQHLQIYADMKEALTEVKEIRSGKKKAKTLQELIGEL